MLHAQTQRVQCNALVLKRPRRSVFHIAGDRMSRTGKLNANLMVSSRRRPYLDQRNVRAPGDRAVRELRSLGARTGLVGQPGMLPVPYQTAGQCSFLRFDRPLENGPVDFLNAPLPEFRRQTRGGLGRPGEQHHTGNGAIQAVHQAEKNIPRFVVFRF